MPEGVTGEKKKKSSRTSKKKQKKQTDLLLLSGADGPDTSDVNGAKRGVETAGRHWPESTAMERASTAEC